MAFDIGSDQTELTVVPMPGDIFFRFYLVATWAPSPSHYDKWAGDRGPGAQSIPEDHLLEGFGNRTTPGAWTDHGPGAAMPLSANPYEALTVPRMIGHQSNGGRDATRIFMGTSLGRMLERDVKTSAWFDRMVPTPISPCDLPGPRPTWLGKVFNVGTAFITNPARLSSRAGGSAIGKTRRSRGPARKTKRR